MQIHAASFLGGAVPSSESVVYHGSRLTESFQPVICNWTESPATRTGRSEELEDAALSRSS